MPKVGDILLFAIIVDLQHKLFSFNPARFVCVPNICEPVSLVVALATQSPSKRPRCRLNFYLEILASCSAFWRAICCFRFAKCCCREFGLVEMLLLERGHSLQLFIWPCSKWSWNSKAYAMAWWVSPKSSLLSVLVKSCVKLDPLQRSSSVQFFQEAPVLLFISLRLLRQVHSASFSVRSGFDLSVLLHSGEGASSS